jgi:hypothetical protein
MHEFENLSILVVGTVRNVENTITREINKCLQALVRFKTIKFFLVESDSRDKTLLKLELLKNTLSDFSFSSLGKLEQQIPDRLERIRYCRNFYVQYIRTLSNDNRPMYVLVVDLDGMNFALNSKSILSCFVRDDWDVVVANQTFGYYDILALRHPTWQKNDWSEEYRDEKKKADNLKLNSWFYRIRYHLELDKIKNRVLYSKMLRINKKDSWIEIESGYGGAAIYKTKVFLKYDYSKEFNIIEADSVSLHRKLLRDKGKIFINPRFINSHFNTYNLNRYFVIRIIRNLIWNNKRIYESKFYKSLKKLPVKMKY